MDRFSCLIGNGGLAALVCALLLCVLLSGPLGRQRQEAQPVFFSLLFPQLAPELPWEFGILWQEDGQQAAEGAVFL